MNSLREWVLQVRYPYTAGFIAVIWIGTALFVLLSPKAPTELLVGCVAVATLIIASIGFRER